MALEVIKLPQDEINDDVILCAINFVNCDPWLEVPLFLRMLNQNFEITTTMGSCHNSYTSFLQIPTTRTQTGLGL